MTSLASRALNRLRRTPALSLSDDIRRRILNSYLFDASWYLERNPEISRLKLDPLGHYLEYGSREGRWPNPLFDPDWYRERYPDVAASGVEPLLHYIEHGALETFNGRQGRDPHPLFSTSWYLERSGSARASDLNPLAHYLAFGGVERVSPHPLFDTGWYDGQDQRSARERSNPLIAFLLHWRDLQIEPHPLFDTAFYVRANPELLETGENPLVHYLRVGGERLELVPHPLFDSRHYNAHAGGLEGENPLSHYVARGAGNLISPNPLFDASWYAGRYQRDSAFDLAPLHHYVVFGAEMRAEPNFLFDSAWYAKQKGISAEAGSWVLRHFQDCVSRSESAHPCFDGPWYLMNYPEVEQARTTALADFLAHGEKAGRTPHPLFAKSWCAGPTPTGRSRVREYLDGSWHALGSPHPLFDQDWFERTQIEPDSAGLAPLYRFLRADAGSALDPNPFFDTRFYTATYQDVADSGLNALAHYVVHGDLERRRPAGFMDAEWYASRHIRELGDLGVLGHFMAKGYAQGYRPNATSTAAWPTVEPDVYNATMPLSRYLDSVNHHIRAVLAAEQLKGTAGYDAWLDLLISRLQATPLNAAQDAPVVSVILPVYNGLHFTIGALLSIAANPPSVPFEVIVIDNVSNDRTEEILGQTDGIRYVRNEVNVGYLRSNNRAAAVARGEYLFLLNNDTMVCPGWMDELLHTFEENDGIGLAGSKLIYPDGVLQEAGGIIWNDGSAWNYGRNGDPSRCEVNYVRQVDYCSAAAVMVPRRLWDEIGGFDELFVPSYCEDSDLALRIRARGYGVVYAPGSTVIHFEGMTQGRDTASGVKAFQIANTQKLRDRWRDYFRTLQNPGEDLDVAKDRGVKKRVLFLDNCTPQPDEDAGSITVMNLMLLLKNSGFQVTFVPQDNFLYLGRYTRDIQRRGIEVLHGPDWHSVEDHLKQHGDRYDLIVMYRPDSHTRHIEAVQTYSPAAATIYHTCDVHFVRMGRQAELMNDKALAKEARDMKVREFKAMRSTDLTILHSDTEKAMLAPELGSTNFKVFNWAVPIEMAETPFEQRKDLLFVGGYNHQPNVDAAVFFVAEVLPLILREDPSIKVHLVGSRVPEEVKALAGPNVIVHGYVADIGPMMAATRISIAPLRYGAGTKGKIATALSVGLPTVTTTVGAEGMGLQDNVNVLIADKPAAMAAKILRLYEDGDLWRRIARNGLDYANEVLGPKAARSIFDDILADLNFQPPADRPELRLVSPVSARLLRPSRTHIAALVEISTVEDLAGSVRHPAVISARRHDDILMAEHDDGEAWTFPGWSVPAARRVDFKIAGQRHKADTDGWTLLGDVICPVTGLNNRERLLAATLEAMRLDLPQNAVIGLYESKAFTSWLKAAHPKLRLVQLDGSGKGKNAGPKSAPLDLVLGGGNSMSNAQFASLLETARALLRPDGSMILVPPKTADGSPEDLVTEFLASQSEPRSGYEMRHADLVRSPELGHIGRGLFRLILRKSTTPFARPTPPTSDPVAKLSIRPPVKTSARQPVKTPAKQAVGQLVKKPATQPAKQAVGQLVKKPATQPAKQAASQPVKKPATQPAKQAVGQSVKKPATRPAKQAVGQPVKKPATQPAKQVTKSRSVAPSVKASTVRGVSKARKPAPKTRVVARKSHAKPAD